MSKRQQRDGRAVAAMIREGIAQATGPCVGTYVHNVTRERRDVLRIEPEEAAFFVVDPATGRDIRFAIESRAAFDLWLAGAEFVNAREQAT